MLNRYGLLFLSIMLTGPALPQSGVRFRPFSDASLPVDARLNDLMSRLTLEQKAGLMLYNSPGIDSLNIPSYNWWNEALHGVARAGKATVFPQAIAMAATFDDSLVYHVASAISDEAGAKYHAAVSKNNRAQYAGLTFWSPNINIFRDPRWGRGQETYGEDPYLTACQGAAFVRGLQGNNPSYLKAAACAKHFAVHSGPEKSRHKFDAIPDERDLRETFLEGITARAGTGTLVDYLQGCRLYTRIDTYYGFREARLADVTIACMGLTRMLEGEEGGNALADILFGDVNPSGKLPVTFYKSVDDLPPFDDYSMDNRTYRYFKGEPAFEFGFGLSYTTFDFLEATPDKEEASMNDTVSLSVTIQNTGNYDGDEVIQVYGSKTDPLIFRPKKTLISFKRVHLKKGETKQVTVPVAVRTLACWDVQKHQYVIEPGKYELQVGASSKDIRLRKEIRVIE